MIDFDEVVQLPLKLIIGVLLVIQLVAYAVGYQLTLQQYVSCSIVLLAVPIAYFGFHYLRTAKKQLKAYEAVSRIGSTQETNREVEKLQSSEEYKAYLERKRLEEERRKRGEQEQIREGETLDNLQQIERIFEELQEKETEIFDFD